MCRFSLRGPNCPAIIPSHRLSILFEKFSGISIIGSHKLTMIKFHLLLLLLLLLRCPAYTGSATLGADKFLLAKTTILFIKLPQAYIIY